MLNYLKASQDAKKDSDRDVYSLKHLYPVFSGKLLKDITQSDVFGYIEMRREEGAGASTINREVGLIRTAINYANKHWGWQQPNPAMGCKQKEPEGRVKWLEGNDYERLIAAAAKNVRAPHLVPFIQLAVNTGFRKGELLGLEWSRVDLQHRMLYLEGQHTKTQKSRSLPLNQHAVAALKTLQEFREEHCPKSPWVFCRKDGSRLKDIKRGFQSALQEAGIKDFRPHDLRHDFASKLIRSGVPIYEVKELLGHQSMDMTQRYAHLDPTRLRKAVDAI